MRNVWAGYSEQRRHATTYAERVAVGQIWKPRAIGEAFGLVVADLQNDGFTLSFSSFVRVIEAAIRDNFSRMSDEPFSTDRLEAGLALFWEGAASTNAEAAQLLEEQS